jgi:N-methylhydantoinase A/oxoprolinase/acetone carboxylase beta subunit
VAVDAGRGALVLGIDTGGTYTDGVLMDYDARRVLATAKSLTTKHDLSIGIDQVLQNIHLDNPGDIRMVSVSTTLATNAIAEGKGKRVALFLIGYDPDLIESFHLDRRFATPDFYYFAGGHDLNGQEKEPLDLQGLLSKVNEIKGRVDALAISSYFSPLNPEHEQRTREAVAGVCDLPVVMGHQLSTKLGSVERATTAALNASLLAVLQSFVIAVRRAMERQNIHAPLMVVRGDGTLMSDEFAARTPVETIHSGPAASAIGGRFLSGREDALVIDIGGTTTDLALVEGGEVSIREEGAMVADYKTAVKAAQLLSIGLGGDSRIAVSAEKRLTLGPERVVPLCQLAAHHSGVRKRLQALAGRSLTLTQRDDLDYWFLLREPPAEALSRDERVHQLVDLLRDGPLPLPEILKKMGLLHRNQLGADWMFRDDVLGRSGLTPTDLLHLEGRYGAWDEEAARWACEAFSRSQSRLSDELAQEVWQRMTAMIVAAVVTFLTGLPLASLDPAGRTSNAWFFNNSLGGQHPHLLTQIHLRQPIIGIGAPAAILLPPVAEALHTDLLLPEHFEVANAVGAVGGSVMVEEEVLIYPRLSSGGLDVVGYYVQDGESRRAFESLDQALADGRDRGRDRALGAAVRAGAENPQVDITELGNGLDSYRLRIRALGNPRLSG